MMNEFDHDRNMNIIKVVVKLNLFANLPMLVR